MDFGFKTEAPGQSYFPVDERKPARKQAVIFGGKWESPLEKEGLV
jgi:hypothetical protein